MPLPLAWIDELRVAGAALAASLERLQLEVTTDRTASAIASLLDQWSGKTDVDAALAGVDVTQALADYRAGVALPVDVVSSPVWWEYPRCPDCGHRSSAHGRWGCAHGAAAGRPCECLTNQAAATPVRHGGAL